MGCGEQCFHRSEPALRLHAGHDCSVYPARTGRCLQLSGAGTAGAVAAHAVPARIDEVGLSRGQAGA